MLQPADTRRNASPGADGKTSRAANWQRCARAGVQIIFSVLSQQPIWP